jgi:hypothetical protein
LSGCSTGIASVIPAAALVIGNVSIVRPSVV